MSSTSEESKQRARRLPRWRLVALALLGIWVVYLAAANIFLATGVGPGAINRKPEKLLVEWRRAWSVVPGVVHVRDLRIRAQNRVVQWDASIDRARVPIAVHRLLTKGFRTTGASGSGVTFKMRRRLDTREGGGHTELAGRGPDISGLSNPPASPPEEIYQAPENPVPWTLELRSLEMAEVREVWIDSARLRGSGDLSADFELTIREQLELSHGRLSFAGAELELAGDAVADAVDLDLDLTLAPLSPQRDSGKRALRFLSGVITAHADITSLSALDSLFGAADWLTTRASGRLDAKAVIELGELRPQTRLGVDAHDFTVGFAGNQVTGRGTVVAVVAGSEPQFEAVIELDDVALQRVGAERPHASGAHFRYVGTSGRLQISDQPLADLESLLELERARIDDLSVYNDYLLSTDSVDLAGGPAFLSGRLEASASDGSASGELTLETDSLRARAGAVRMAGKMSLQARLRNARLNERRYDLSGSVLRLSNVRVWEHDRERSGWWARVELGRAELVQKARPTLSAELAASMRDSGPIVALVAERKRFLKLVDGLLTVEDVVAKGRLASRADSMSVTGIDVTGGKLEVLGDLELTKSRRDGLLFLRFGMLSAAVEMVGDERDWKLIRSRKWFEEKRAARAVEGR